MSFYRVKAEETVEKETHITIGDGDLEVEDVGCEHVPNSEDTYTVQKISDSGEVINEKVVEYVVPQRADLVLALLESGEIEEEDLYNNSFSLEELKEKAEGLQA